MRPCALHREGVDDMHVHLETCDIDRCRALSNHNMKVKTFMSNGTHSGKATDDQIVLQLLVGVMAGHLPTDALHSVLSMKYFNA